MECKRCGNTDEAYFYKGHKGIYCRKCVSFKRILLEEELAPLEYEVSREAGDYHFDFPLTVFQEEVSLKCRRYIKESDVLLHCVCGAGKTEIVVRTIDDHLKEGLKVCYAISRKEVVKELYERFKRIFPYAKVVALYGGHHSELTGDLIVCTTHQLFRYYRTFDLLILDEVDAFPLSGNKELM
ncbi:MAG: DEAD/DEAH box helicase, partial [Erysipelotrichaceae bacterium]|nr:DEAD/DEAH box helicase [Erysipelotrichaceae bacterium]